MGKTPTKKDKEELALLLEELERRHRYNYVKYLFPDEGPYRRELYPKHTAFFAAGAKYKQRAFVAANRTGKTLSGACELTYHATGQYPDWWEGYRFDKPIEAWVAGKSNESTKEVLQGTLLGDYGDIGSGTIPKDCIVSTVNKPGVPEAILTVRVKHVSGGLSVITFKSYDQGRKAFEGTTKDVIWLDEEPEANDYGIYTECLTRTLTSGGLVLCTFTPLQGVTEIVKSFLPDGQVSKTGTYEQDHKFAVMVTWEEVPHLSKDEKEKLLSSYSPFERDARTKGLPFAAVGLIYQVRDEETIIEPFDIPDNWARAYGFDPSPTRSAIVWGARDPNTGVTYIYDECIKERVEPVILAHAIKSRGEWVPGVIDPQMAQSTQYDQRRLFDVFCEFDLDLDLADNAVEAGIAKCQDRFSTGQLKIFKTLEYLRRELRTYRRDDTGRVDRNQTCDFADAMRYLVMSGMQRAMTIYDADPEGDSEFSSGNDRINLGASEITGY